MVQAWMLLLLWRELLALGERLACSTSRNVRHAALKHRGTDLFCVCWDLTLTMDEQQPPALEESGCEWALALVPGQQSPSCSHARL